jgi:hypothetical protein
MRFWTTSTIAVILTLSWSPISSAAQYSDTVDAHIAAAQRAAGQEHVVLFDTICKPLRRRGNPLNRPVIVPVGTATP